MQYIVSSAGTSGTLEFDFNNTPGAFGLDDIAVGPVPGPTIQSVALSHGNVTLTWNSFSNLTYQVQYATSMIHPNWTNIGSQITATGNVVTRIRTCRPGPATVLSSNAAASSLTYLLSRSKTMCVWEPVRVLIISMSFNSQWPLTF